MGPNELLGKVLVEQLKYDNEGRRILERISPLCTICNKNNYYNIYKFYEYDPEIKLFIVSSNYAAICPVCGDKIELDFEEFLTLKLFIKINRQLEKGKISEHEHREKTRKIKLKLSKKLMNL